MLCEKSNERKNIINIIIIKRLIKLKDLNETAINQIRKDFYYFHSKTKKKFLIEKEPRNILNFLIIKIIFPYSKFIFIKKSKIHNNFKTIKHTPEKKSGLDSPSNLFIILVSLISNERSSGYISSDFG